MVESGWHTELCLAPADLSGRLATLAGEFPAKFLCFGFGELGMRDYGPRPRGGETLASLAPSEAVLLVLPLDRPPAEAFDTASGDAQVLALRVSDAGARNLSEFVWRSVLLGPDGAPVHLRPGVNEGSMFFAASGTYNAPATCNTWSATGLRMAGLPVNNDGDFHRRTRDRAGPQTIGSQASLP